MKEIEKFMQEQGKELKDTTKQKPSVEFAKLSASEKWALVEKLLRDLGYID